VGDVVERSDTEELFELSKSSLMRDWSCEVGGKPIDWEAGLNLIDKLIAKAELEEDCKRLARTIASHVVGWSLIISSSALILAGRTETVSAFDVVAGQVGLMGLQVYYSGWLRPGRWKW
jgi:hypothetical protein